VKDRHDGRVKCAVQEALEMIAVQDQPIHDSGSLSFLRKLINSLRGTNFVLCDTKYFLRETINSLRGTSIVLCDKIYFLRETINSLRGTDFVFCDTNYFLRETNNFLWGTTEAVFRDTNYFLRETNNSFRGTNAVFQDMSASNLSVTKNYCQSDCDNQNKNKSDTDTCLITLPGLECDNKTFDNIKGVLITDHCSRILQHSKALVNRKLRDREPSRLSLKRVLNSLKHRKLRKRNKRLIKNSVPASSVLYGIASQYKQWHIRFLKRQDSFYSNYFESKSLYNVSKLKTLLSGDIELNPGPRGSSIVTSSRAICNEGYISVFNNRLHTLGLSSLDVGGNGDCLFKAVAHQLYNDASRHLEIRAAGVQYLQDNPDQFKESLTDNMTWSQYLTEMSRQGTWADHIVIQAVADAMNLKINIVESSENFAEITLVEATCVSQNCRTVYIGHIGEVHYVSTVQRSLDKVDSNVFIDCQTCNVNGCKRKYNLSELQEAKPQSANKAKKHRTNKTTVDAKEKKRIYMKKYRADKKAKLKAYMRNYRAKTDSSEQKEKLNAYMRNYRAQTESPDQKAKHNASMRNHRALKTVSEKAQQNAYMKTYRAKTKNNIELTISKFHEVVSQGPLYVCTCCDQLWYKHGVLDARKLRELTSDVDKYLSNNMSVDNVDWVCLTCYKYLVKDKMPPLSVVNGMKFPERPAFFDLNELECRLLAPRIAFQKLMQAPRGKQLKIHGNVVNVPADVTNTVSMLPRLPSEACTIKVNLKRKLQYKSSALSLNIRPQKVVQAAVWLMNNSTLYKDEGITLNSDWAKQYNEEVIKNNDIIHNVVDGLLENTQNSQNNEPQDLSDDHEWSEDEAEVPAGVTDTMLTSTDFLENNERQLIMNIAPGEGNRPLSIFRDKYSEELAYPGIFLGQKRPESKRVHYSDICKSELRRSDRRAAMCVENIFYKAKKLQMKILLGQCQIALRKCKGSNKNLKAHQLKQHGAVESLIRYDEGFKFLRALRGSPPYFEKAKRDLFAMIRQLGPATLFCSFSSAETQWLYLLRILGQLVDHKQYTDTELENLNWEERCRLIQSDPVTCARHFDYQVNQFLRNFLLSSAEPLGNISDWFYRVEYQQRGSPHIHMLIWVEDAPEFQVKSDEEVIAYIDRIITCQKPVNNPELLNLVNRQLHRHSHTCHKNTRSECRFNYPQPPMRETNILYPLDSDMPEDELKIHKDNWKMIKKHLDDMKEGEEISFDQLLHDLQVTEENYLLAVRSSLHAATVFLKRNPNELRINNYNPACLSAWRANMDIQFVLDVYACAVYIVNYISKAQKGMSELLREACDEGRKGNSSIKQQVRDIGSKFVNNVEISAQEAVYIVLQLPMRKSSRQIVFINTSPPEERVELLKPLNDIKEMDDDCEDIYTNGLLKRYSKRPARLEYLTLADWAAWYDKSGKAFVKSTNELDADGLPIETFIDHYQNDDDFDSEEQQFDKKSCSKMKKRKKARIIRSVWFNKEAESEKHYRELLMLFTPWRNEGTDLLGTFSSYQERYMALSKLIDKQMKEYAVCDEDLNEIQQDMNRIEESYETVAPCTEQFEQQDYNEGVQDLHPDFNESYNLSNDLGIPSADSNTEPLILNELLDDEYRTMVQSLNREQKEFFYHVLHLIKTSDKPFYCFLSGGAGVGKSHVTKALYQAAIKYYNSRAGDNFADIKVLMLAPTGKAAYNIKGNTIHNALAIPACQSLKNYKRLDSSRLNSLRCQLGGLKLIFIDEISMVGNTMFNVQIDNRLKDIKGSPLPFGGVSIIAIGDLFQLQPVMDDYIFKYMDNLEYSILAPNLWQELFKMFELHEIMRQKESKQFAELLNRLREGKHIPDDIVKLKQRILKANSSSYPIKAPHLFIQNAKVNDFNERVHRTIIGTKYTIKAHDSVIGANSTELRDKILKQIPTDPRKTKQLHGTLNLAVGERTEISLNTRTDDGITNGAGNVVKHIQIHQTDKPSGIIWIQFDHTDVGEKTRHENKHLYVSGIEATWTPIKPVTTQFSVGRNRTVQVVRKQFPLRPAAAKTIHRSQGDTETTVVVNFETRRAIPHIHYVGLSRVKTIEGLHITDLCEDKIAVSAAVQKEMENLRTERKLDLCISPIYRAQQSAVKICFLNARSLHKHICDIQADLNYSSSDVNIFAETRFSHRDNNTMYNIDKYILFRNDAVSSNHQRPYGGTAVYSCIDYYPGYPYSYNRNGIEITVIRLMIIPHVTIIAVYRSPAVPVRQFCMTMQEVLTLPLTQMKIFIGDFNVNWLNMVEKAPLSNLFVRENCYRQLMSFYTTDHKTCIDHVYTNLPEKEIKVSVLETYFSDHKAIYALLNCFQK